MNYIILRKFLERRDCNRLIANSKFFNTPEDLGQLDDGFKSNTWIKAAERNIGMEYRYQNDKDTLRLASGIIEELLDITGIQFHTTQDKALVLCRYNDGGMSATHRDREKGLDGTKDIIFQKYSCICQLTEPGIDFYQSSIPNESTSKDTFFINFYPSTVSRDRKTVVEQFDMKSRIYPNLHKGDCIIFRNDISVHGVDPILVFSNQQGRITCGFRSL